MQPTWTRINWLWFPIRVGVVINLQLLQGLYWLVLIYERIATLAISNKARNDTADSVWSLSTEVWSLHNSGTDSGSQHTADIS